MLLYRTNVHDYGDYRLLRAYQGDIFKKGLFYKKKRLTIIERVCIYCVHT